MLDFYISYLLYLLYVFMYKLILIDKQTKWPKHHHSDFKNPSEKQAPSSYPLTPPRSCSPSLPHSSPISLSDSLYPPHLHSTSSTSPANKNDSNSHLPKLSSICSLIHHSYDTDLLYLYYFSIFFRASSFLCYSFAAYSQCLFAEVTVLIFGECLGFRHEATLSDF